MQIVQTTNKKIILNPIITALYKSKKDMDDSLYCEMIVYEDICKRGKNNISKAIERISKRIKEYNNEKDVKIKVKLRQNIRTLRAHFKRNLDNLAKNTKILSELLINTLVEFYNDLLKVLKEGYQTYFKSGEIMKETLQIEKKMKVKELTDNLENKVGYQSSSNLSKPKLYFTKISNTTVENIKWNKLVKENYILTQCALLGIIEDEYN